MKKQIIHKIRISRKTKKRLKKSKFSSIFYKVWREQLIGSRYTKILMKIYGL